MPALAKRNRGKRLMMGGSILNCSGQSSVDGALAAAGGKAARAYRQEWIQINRVEVFGIFNFLTARYRERLPVAITSMDFHALSQTSDVFVQNWHADCPV